MSAGTDHPQRRPRASKRLTTYLLAGSLIIAIVLLNLLQFVDSTSAYSFIRTHKNSQVNHDVLNENLRKFSEHCQNNQYKFDPFELSQKLLQTEEEQNKESNNQQEKKKEKKKTKKLPYKISHDVFDKDDECSRYETITFEHLDAQNEQLLSSSPDSKNAKFSYKSPVLILSSVSDESSYGNHKDRTFKNFLNMLNKINYAKDLASVGISVKSYDEFEKLKLLITEYYQAPSLVQYFHEVEEQDTTFQKRGSGNKNGDDDDNSDSGTAAEYRGKFRKIVLVHAPFIENSFQVNRDSRHDASIQKKRRSVLAKVRNFLINTVLTEEKYTLFVDSDIVELPYNMLNHFIMSNKDVIVPRIQKGINCFDYDQNSWTGERSHPSEEELHKLDKNKDLKLQKLKEQSAAEEGEKDAKSGETDKSPPLKDTRVKNLDSQTLEDKELLSSPAFLKAQNGENKGQADKNQQQDEFIYVPMQTKNTRLLLQLSRQLEPNSEQAFNYYVPIESVGGAVLFAKSIIFKQGIQFPPLYIVGTDWSRLEGFDGIETEGLCYQAKILGYECWGAPDVVAQHYDS